MNAQVLDGKALSKALRVELKGRVDALKAKGVAPKIHVLVASQDPASLAYVRMKRKWAEAAGMESGRWDVLDTTTQDELIARIDELNADPAVHGVLLQHPLPNHLDEDAAFAIEAIRQPFREQLSLLMLSALKSPITAAL